MDRMKQHDRMPNWRAQCLDGGDPVNLTTASAVKVLGRQNSALVIEETIAGPYAADGWVEMEWPADSTDTLGFIDFEIEVTWTGAPGPQTFPAQGYLRTTIYRDLG